MIDAKEFELQGIFISLIAEVSGTYVDLINLQCKQQVNLEKLKLIQDAFQLTKARVDAGLENESYLNKWQISHESSKIQSQIYAEQIQMLIHKLGLLLGKQPGQLNEKLNPAGEVILLPEKIISTGVPAELLRRRPDIQKSERMLFAETTQIEVDKANLYPRFFLNGYFNLSASDISKVFTSGSQAYGFGPSVSWNILSRKPVKFKIKAQEEKVNQALYGFRQSVLVALQEVEIGILSFSKEKIRLDSYLQNQQAAIKIASIAQSQFDSGMVNYLQVINAKLELLEHNLAILNSKNSSIKNLIYLYKALGGGWVAPEETSKATTTTNVEKKKD